MRRFYLCFIVCLFAGCSQIETTPALDVDESSLIKQDLRIDKGTNPITAEQAVNVALLFNSSQPQTKAKGSKEVENVYTISGNDGQPAMYAVNYKNGKGFTIVGTSRKYYPILAFAEKGNFEETNLDSGLGFWVEQQKSAIFYANNCPDNSVDAFSEFWIDFEKSEDPYLQTKSGDLLSLRASTIAYWESLGYTCYSLIDCPNYLDSDVYDDWCDIAEEQSCQEYDYLQNSLIICATDEINTQVGPLINTAWGQDSPYNSLLDPIGGSLPRVGCAIVAMGQIMKYHQWPSSYGWSSMNNNSASYNTELLFHDLGRDAQTTYGVSASSTNINNLKTAITSNQYSYHYSADIISHNVNTAISNINSYKPVYMQGESSGSAHAWVCEGRKTNTITRTYSLLILSPYEPLEYISAGTPYESRTTTTHLYMNWGEDGDCNGWFIGDQVYVSQYLYNVLIQFNYAYNRKDIVNITPNRN